MWAAALVDDSAGNSAVGSAAPWAVQKADGSAEKWAVSTAAPWAVQTADGSAGPSEAHWAASMVDLMAVWSAMRWVALLGPWMAA